MFSEIWDIDYEQGKIFISSQNLKRQTTLIHDVKRGSEYQCDGIAPLGLTAATRR